MSGHISERVPFLVSFPINAKQILSEDFSIGFLLLWIRWLCGCAVVRCCSDADHLESAQTPQVGGTVASEMALTSDTKHKLGIPQASPLLTSWLQITVSL